MMQFDYGTLTEALSGRVWTREDIAQQLAQRVARCQRLGVARGDRVFLLFGNCNEFFVELLALWHLGACAVPIDPRLSAFELANLVATAQPRLAIAHDTTTADMVQALRVAGLKVCNTLELDAPVSVAVAASLEDDALILFTSGSTGQPKGVVHTHRTLGARWSGLREHLGLAAFRRSLCLLPTHFGHGLICNSLFPWLSGCDLVILPPFQPAILMRLGQIVDAQAITFMSSVPAVWQLALKLAVPPKGGSLQRVHVGSAPLSAAAWEGIRQWAGTANVCNAYGITETGSWVAGLDAPAAVPAQDGLVGTGWGAQIRILHNADTSLPLNAESECAPGETGHVWLQTPALMKGYFLRDDLTAQVVRDGWFMTGDLGYLDAQGYLVLRGRERDEINKGGMKIYPTDVDVVVERFAGVRDVCTFALDDAVYGQTVAMAVVLNQRDDTSIRALQAWMRTHLAEHKLPVKWWLLDEIARSSRGKLNREAVKEFCLQQAPVDLAAILARGEG